jgi:hypothetical protein
MAAGMVTDVCTASPYLRRLTFIVTMSGIIAYMTDVDTPPEQFISDRRTAWLEELSPADYKRCMALLEEVLGIPYRFSPGATSAALLRSLHANGKRMLPVEMPPPALEPTTERDLSWIRELTAEEREAPFVVCYDVNAAYLAACSALPCGVGAPRKVGRAAPFDLDRVGYFRWPTGVWKTSIAVKYWCELRKTDLPPLREAWIWDETSRPLEPWYKVLRHSRETLMIELMARGRRPFREPWPEPSIRAALQTVKHMYTDLIGRMASTNWDRTGDPLFRPDIRHMVIATRRTRVQRVMSMCDPAPFAASCDQLYFAVNASPQVTGLRMGTSPGTWKIHGTVRHEGNVRAATDAGDLSRLVELVR